MGIAIPLAVLGILGASNLIISKIPSAKDLIAKLAPYQGWLGAGTAFWGIYNLIFFTILGMDLLASHPLHYIVGTVVVVLMIALGLLFGVGTIKTFVKQPQAIAKMDQLVAKLAPFQGGLGLAGIATAVVFIVVF